MRKGGGEGGDIHREGKGVSLIFEAIGDSCGQAPIFLLPRTRQSAY